MEISLNAIAMLLSNFDLSFRSLNKVYHVCRRFSIRFSPFCGMAGLLFVKTFPPPMMHKHAGGQGDSKRGAAAHERDTYKGGNRILQDSMAICYAVLLFFLPVNGVPVLVLFQFPDEVPNNLDFLPPVAAGLVRRMDDNPLFGLGDFQLALFRCLFRFFKSLFIHRFLKTHNVLKRHRGFLASYPV